MRSLYLAGTFSFPSAFGVVAFYTAAFTDREGWKRPPWLLDQEEAWPQHGGGLMKAADQCKLLKKVLQLFCKLQESVYLH